MNILKSIATESGYKISPAIINQWAQKYKNEFTRGPENAALINSMTSHFYDSLGGVSTAAFLQLSGADLVLDQSLAKGIQGGGKVDPSDLGQYEKGMLRRASKMMAGFALTMEYWAYPACRFYYRAQQGEASEFCSKDFTTKHLASTEDEKSSLKAAKIRATPTTLRDVDAYGPIVTAHSGAIQRPFQQKFKKEIETRQKEFTDTHVRLCKYFADNFLTFQMPNQEVQFVMLDGITFVTLERLGMYEYHTVHGDTPERGEGEYYVHYSVSATADGTSWVAHHLATTADNRALPGNASALTAVIPNQHGFVANDPASYMRTVALG